MTGREYIQYILANHLEDEEIIKDDKIAGFLTVYGAASKFNVGIETINAWIKLGRIGSVWLNGKQYIPANAEPKEVSNE